MSLSYARSAMRTIRLNWPVVTILTAGTLASLWAAQIAWQPLVIVVAGLAVTGTLARLIATKRLSPVAQGVMDVLAQSMDTLPDGLLAMGENVPKVAVNQSLVDLWHLPPGTGQLEDPDAILETVFDRVADADRLRADIALLEREPDTPIHRDVTLHDGSVFECNAGSMGSPIGRRIYFVFHDVSQRRALEREQQFANALLRTQMEASPLGILVVDASGSIAAHNQRFVELSKVPAGLFADGNDSPVLAAFAAQVTDTDAFLARLQELYADPEERAVDEIVMKDGRILERCAGEMKSATGQSFGRVWFFSDITEMRASERALREERDFVDVLLDSLPGYFVLLDDAGHLVRWNESLRFLNGLTDDELLGANALANILEDDRAATFAKLRETIVNGRAEFEFRITSRSGVPFNPKASRKPLVR